jgi:hypothetical protein
MTPFDPNFLGDIYEMMQLGDREIGGLPGRFNFSVPHQPAGTPETGGTPAPLFAYDVTEGPYEGHRWGYQLDPKLQGGRWEEAHHAPDDFERYKQMPIRKRRELLERMWGAESPIVQAIEVASELDLPFESLVRMLEEHRTHRQVSYGEPK